MYYMFSLRRYKVVKYEKRYKIIYLTKIFNIINFNIYLFFHQIIDFLLHPHQHIENNFGQLLRIH